MGADIFRELCQAEPLAGPEKVRKSQTSHGNRVTGTEVGRSTRVTGDEPGTCKLVTGTEYLAPEQVGAFCGTAPPPGPRKVGQSATLGGKPVSGVLVGRSTKVTGDEAGAGVRPTGTQYTNPSDPTDGGAPPKVGLSLTLSGKPVTGTRVSRSTKVTGDEPGSCRNITGDEYIDYLLGARAGQEMAVSLIPGESNGDANIYFNILPPGSTGEAIYIGSIDGLDVTGVALPETGDYTIRVYQLGNDAK
jgi:hypothetical protein